MKKKDKPKKLNKFINFAKENFLLCWYFFWTILLTIYIMKNWTLAISFVFFSQFNGINLLFIVWIILLITPIINKMEGMGISLNSPISEALSKKADELKTIQDESIINEDHILLEQAKQLSSIDKKRGEQDGL